eukprot:UN15797
MKAKNSMSYSGGMGSGGAAGGGNSFNSNSSHSTSTYSGGNHTQKRTNSTTSRNKLYSLDLRLMKFLRNT